MRAGSYEVGSPTLLPGGECLRQPARGAQKLLDPADAARLPGQQLGGLAPAGAQFRGEGGPRPTISLAEDTLQSDRQQDRTWRGITLLPGRGGCRLADAPMHPPYLWWSGQRVPWDEAHIHVTQLGWPALTAVFEGIRAYQSRDGTKTSLFRFDRHMARFRRSLRFMQLESAWDEAALLWAATDLVQANEAIRDAYVMPVAYGEGGSRGVMTMALGPANIYITTRLAPSKLPDPPALRVAVSSWTRLNDNIMPPRIKAFVNYLNSRLGQTEAARAGYDSTLFLNTAGKVAEGGGSCLFLISDGVAVTPPVTAGILESVTRESVMELLRAELGIRVVEREVDRTELYFADEMFFTGTMIEIAPIRSVDGFEVPGGAAGPITQRLMTLFERVVRGEEPRYRHWLSPIAAR